MPSQTAISKLLSSLKIPHSIKGDKNYIADRDAVMRVKSMKGGAKTKKTKSKSKTAKPKSKKPKAKK